MYKILHIQTIFPTKFLHLKIKIQQQHIHKPKSLIIKTKIIKTNNKYRKNIWP